MQKQFLEGCCLTLGPLGVQAGVDVAATLTAWGKWQPALAPGRGPSVAEALIGSLGGKGAERRVGHPAHHLLLAMPSHIYPP